MRAVENETKTSDSIFKFTQYIVEQGMMATGDALGIMDKEGNLLANVKREIMWPALWFETPDGSRIGEMRPKPFAFEIYDSDGLFEGVVKQKLTGQIPRTRWLMEDSWGQTIAEAIANLSAYNYTIQAPTGTQIARIHKKWSASRGVYAVEIHNTVLEPYLILAFSIAVDQFEHHDKGLA